VIKKTNTLCAPKIPEELSAAIASNPKARSAFLALPPSHRREYASWIMEGKKPETRRQRSEKAVRMIAAKISKK
jgi:uncharacterized protein YdeI (YjbR/CyaY-like superfamily)